MSTSSLLLLLLSLCGSCYCRCPESWVQNGSSCYFYNQQPLPWVEANVVCKLLGSVLVEIKSAAENTFVTSLVSGKPVGFTWIGINDIVTDGKWLSTSTGRPVVYTNWAVGEPNNYQGKSEDCVSIYNTGLWNDEQCATTTQFPSVCQRPA